MRIEISPIRADYTAEELALMKEPLYTIKGWTRLPDAHGPISLADLRRLRTGK